MASTFATLCAAAGLTSLHLLAGEQGIGVRNYPQIWFLPPIDRFRP
jgi:hypothetical protein